LEHSWYTVGVEQVRSWYLATLVEL